MSTAEQIAFWALIISGITLLTYLGQLVVLILVYRRVIIETDRNAEIRRQEIEKASTIMQGMWKDVEHRLRGMAKNTTLLMLVAALCLAALTFMNDHKIQGFDTRLKIFEKREEK